MIALQQEQKAPNLRPNFPNAYDYYIDYYSEEEEHTFRITKDSWENIHRSNNLNQKLTETELKIISLVSTLIECSSLGLAYFSLDYLCKKLGITDRQLRTVRKNINHIFSSRWRKATRINGTLKKNVYVFTYTLQGRSLLRASTKNHFADLGKMVDIKLNIQKKVQDSRLSTKHYESVKLGSPLPTSIYKDEKDIKDRSSVQAHESNFLQNSISFIPEETIAQKETSKVIPLKHKPIYNKRKKNTHQERKARVYTPKFNQYQQPKTLSEHYPLTQEDCLKLQTSSGRPFTLNAMNEILLDISRKPKESTHLFPSKAAFMAYMSKVYRYEERDAVKTANYGFKILARATKAEVIQHTTQTERESYLNLLEQQAITHRSDENQLKAKWANTLPTNAAYNLLSNMRTVQKVGKMLQVLMDKEIELTEYSRKIILAQAQAVGGFMDVERLEVLVKR